MKILLDTHALLWALEGSGKLSETAKNCFQDPANRLIFSVASLWEICIKISLKKLILKRHWWTALDKGIAENAIQWLPILPEHCLVLETLPFHHRDPFDRMLIVQAATEGAALLSRDDRFDAYSVRRLW